MKKINKLSALLFAAVMAAVTLTAGITVYAAPVAINATNFPDENFRTIVSMECDEDEDGYLSDSELSGVTLFSVTGYLYDLDENAEIESIKGIEYFTNLRTLRCGGIGLKSIDVTKLTNLTWLDCMGNDLEALDVSKNTSLRTLNCQSNDLTTLNVTMLSNLQSLSCSTNQLTTLNVSNNTALTTLQVSQNQLTELNLSSNTQLTSLHCSNNHIKELDLSNNTLLENVTSNRIGEQTIDGTATISEEGTAFIAVAFSGDRDRITATSLDYEHEGETMVAYSGGHFYTDELAKLVDGIDYEYSTGLEGAEPLTVHINVERDFFVVRFFTNGKKQTLISEQIVDRGESATAPEISDTPQCKTFIGWSDTFSDIQTDKDIWANWRDDHIFKITEFRDNTIVMTCLNGCGTTKEYSFFDVVGAEIGDPVYNSALDLNEDGIINGRDLAMLKRGDY